jgi:Domain of unknown function (DUF4190)
VTQIPQAAPPYSQGSYPPPAPNHPSAVPSLVLGILSVVACGLFTGIPAIVMGRRAIREIRADRSRFSGEGMAQAGFWTGVAGTALSAVAVLLLVGLFAVGGTMHSEFKQSCEQIVDGKHHRVQENCR